MTSDNIDAEHDRIDSEQSEASVTEDTVDDAELTPEEKKKKELERFFASMNWKDYLLLFLPLVYLVYNFSILPFKPKLLVDNPELLVSLTGSTTGLIVLGSNYALHGTPWWAWFALGLIPSVLPLLIYYLMGRRWGDEAIMMLFPAEKPRWFVKMESFIRRHPGVSLFLCFIPFSPLPHTIVIALAGMEKVKWYVIGFFTVTFTVLLKGFYLYLGYQFGETVAEVVKQIDKYMMYITFALIAYIFWKAYAKGGGKKKSAAVG